MSVNYGICGTVSRKCCKLSSCIGWIGSIRLVGVFCVVTVGGDCVGNLRGVLYLKFVLDRCWVVHYHFFVW